MPTAHTRNADNQLINNKQKLLSEFVKYYHPHISCQHHRMQNQLVMQLKFFVSHFFSPFYCIHPGNIVVALGRDFVIDDVLR